MSPRVLLSLAAIFVSLATAFSLDAAPVIPGYERLVADQKHVPAESGRVLAGELNCRSCHAGDKAPASKPAPILDEVGSRVQAAWIQKFIADPHATKPGTTMPGVLSTDSKTRQQQAEAITHYLLSLGKQTPVHQYASLGARRMGEELYFRVGCAACHQHSPDGTSKPLATTVTLPDLSGKYTLGSLTAFLRDPLHVRPGGRMPSLNLDGQEAKAIAAWLLKTPELARIKYSYYEGSWNSMPDFTEIEPKTQGEADKIDVSYRKRNDQFGLRFEAGLNIDEAGEYKFHIGSDDGSRLLIDGKVVASAPGVHPYQVKSGAVQLDSGSHLVVIEYFEQGGEEKLVVEYEGPGVKRQPIANALSSTDTPPDLPDLAFSVDPAKAEQGKKLFAGVGCANCHASKDERLRVASTLAAPAWDRLQLERGCLGDSNKSPRYDLNESQLTALRVAARQQSPSDAATKVRLSMTAYNCYACHERDGIGGVEPARDATFQTTMKEIGDEGRIPPMLNQVGAKLTDFWLDKTLAEGARDRPYMHTRMPKFGKDNVGQMRHWLVELDEQAPLEPIGFDVPMKQVKEHGRKMVGIRGFSCTQCHRFGRFPSKGIQSVDFQVMSKRLRKDWFRQYVRDPKAYRQGTRMPTAWPLDQPSLLKDIFDGDSDMQIAAVWEYLSDGPRARIPEGMATQSMELIPINEALIYRNFIEGAGPRAIAVGYPEQIHQAFDANQMRIAMLWEGKFIDASRHWTGRGQGFQPPAGENILTLHDGAPLARLENLDQSWPTEPAKALGFQFGGYQFDDDEQRPTFLYRLGEVRVEEFLRIRPDDDEQTMARREVKVIQPGKNLFFRAAVGAKIEQANGWFTVDGRYHTKIQGAAAELRQSANKTELLVPIAPTASGQAKFQQDFRW